MANYKQQLDNILRTFQEGGNVKKPAPRTGSRMNADGTQSTHLYAIGEVYGKIAVFPTLFQNEKGEYYEVEVPVAEAIKKKEILYFDNQQEAEDFAKGSWKESVFQSGDINTKARENVKNQHPEQVQE